MSDTSGPRLSIEALNRADTAHALEMLSPVIERSPWLAERIVAQRPFADRAELGGALKAAILGLNEPDALRLLRAHPELAPSAPEDMTDASQREQGRLSLARPSADLAIRLADLNRRYNARFGFPFIIALHALSDMDAVIAQFEGRLKNTPQEERARALGEVVSVVLARLARLSEAGPAAHVAVTP
jgi:OHCU decarboxylase